ncbi:MAG: hypothetical protein OEL52_01135 [Nitrosopumilus sp.]|nr:hypothetical protein [Nitrosopumilus sp.]
MRIKCPCCTHSFAVSEDDIFLDYSDDVDYDDSNKYVWEELPLLRSSCDFPKENQMDSSRRNHNDFLESGDSLEKNLP